MSEALKLGDVVRYKLTNQHMTVISAGPVPASSALGVTARMAVPQTMSSDHVECKWFEKNELKKGKQKKADLEFIKSTDFYNPQKGQMVELASGGPRMIVSRTGPKDFSVALASGMGVAKTNGSIRHDLVGCRWESGKVEVRGEFEIGIVKPI